MKDSQASVSRRWKKEYTFLLIANAVYILVFYVIMRYYTF